MAPFAARSARAVGAADPVDRRGLLASASPLAGETSPSAGSAAAAGPAADDSPTAAERPAGEAWLPLDGRPRLLRSLTEADSNLWLSVHILEAGKARVEHERIRLEELLEELWPGVERSSDWVRSICRDIRRLDDVSNQSFLIKATCKAILVRTDFVKAVVEPHRVTFLNSESPTFHLFLDEFLADERWNAAPEGEGAFSNWVVECIVCASVTLHDMRFKLVKPVGNHILESTRTTDFNSVLRLYPLKLTLSTFVEQLRPAVKCLHDIVHSDEDGDRLRSRASRKRECAGSSGSGDMEQCFSTSLEEALYNWYHNAEEIMSDAIEMCQRIEDSLRFAEASMSCTRNRLLKFELWTMIATVAFGVGAFISGVFGMNLDNYGFDKVPGAFWHVCAVITVLIGMIIFLSWYVIDRSQHHYHTHAPKFGNNRFFREINTDEYVLSLSSALPNGDASQGSGRRRILQELQTTALPRGTGDSSPLRRRLSGRSLSGGITHGQLQLQNMSQMDIH